jgi:pilus assembly protein FimV
MTRRLDQLMMLVWIGLPATSQAIGLGDIKVQSALNEPLVAQIDIVGASPEELSSLSAAVANLDTFLRYGADRPAFLTSASFRVSHDAAGRPVLLVKSREAFTEPLVSLLVDMRSTSGELVREYTLLLDPATRVDNAPGTTAALPQTAAAATPAPVVTANRSVPANRGMMAERSVMADRSATANPSVTADRGVTPERSGMADRNATANPVAAPQNTYTVSAHDTLDGIARRIGGASRNNLSRMVLAIYHGNPAAFDGNINRLHQGATLQIPSAALVAAMSKTEADREFVAQMAAWHGPAVAMLAAAPAHHADAHPQAAVSLDKTTDGPKPTTMPTTGPAMSLTGPAPASPPVPAAALASTPAPAAALANNPAPADDALDQRLRSVESALEDTKRLQASEHAELLALRQRMDGSNGSTATLQDGLPAAAAAASGTTSATAAPTAVAGSTPEAAAKPASDGAPAAASAGHPRLLVFALAFGALVLAALVALRLRRRAAEDAAATVDDDMIEAGDAWSPADEQQTMKTLGIIENVRSTLVAREEPPAAAAVPVPAAAVAPPGLEHDSMDIDTSSLLALPEMSAPARPAGSETTVILAFKNVDDGYTSVDLDSTETHVQMPSGLHDHQVFNERRTNPADVLRQAIARHPDRNDLKIKLLEMYYDATASNRQAFLEVARKLALELDSASDEEWAKIMDMGKAIAGDDSLFSESTGNTQTQPHQAISG